MDSTHGAGDGVVEQYGCAVGGKDHQSGAGVVGNEGIALGVRVVVNAHMVLLCDHSDDVGVGLMGQHQVFFGKAQGIAQNSQVPGYIFRGVTPVQGNIQAGEVALAHATQPGGEAVGHGDVCGDKIFQISKFF